MLNLPDARRIIRNYNKMAAVLMQFEMLYHRAWIKQVDVVKAGNILMCLQWALTRFVRVVCNFPRKVPINVAISLSTSLYGYSERKQDSYNYYCNSHAGLTRCLSMDQTIYSRDNPRFVLFCIMIVFTQIIVYLII